MNLCQSIPLDHLEPTVSGMTTLGQRLQQALDRRGRTPPSLIHALGVSKGTVYNILNDTTTAEKVWATTALAICRELGISLTWLLSGKGSMDAKPMAANDDDWAPVEGFAQAVGLGNGEEAQEYAETHSLKFRAESLAKKRLNPRSLAVMYGAGDSMLPRIHPGDAILFDRDDTRPRDGHIFVVQVPGAGGNEIQAKRCMVLDETVYFAADNANGDHHWRKPKRMDDRKSPIQIIGRVRWIGSWEG
jgi:phage repressor protein C with HTH and peptisase S24 domain